ncbi:MAG: carbohydrate kinase [Cyclobacteriaceae bacterium]|nr:carbohydrate kinase [Cyclobacteriaceae bacterium]
MNTGKQVITFGEILFDVIDDKPYLGGAPMNLAGHMSKLGANCRILSALGNDELGKMALQKMRDLNIKTDGIHIHPSLPTGTVEVSLKEGMPDYVIRENVAWDNIQLSATDNDGLHFSSDVFCFGSLAQRTQNNKTLLHTILRNLSSGEIFYDVNLRRSYFTIEVISESLKMASIVKLNDEEVLFLSQWMFEQSLSTHDFAKKLIDKFGVKIVIVTAGADGAYAFNINDSFFSQSNKIEVADTVGAGDAFSAAFLFTYLHTENLQKALDAGNVMGAYVASRQGAIPDYSADLLKKLKGTTGLTF